jgi:hypothetical protein
VQLLGGPACGGCSAWPAAHGHAGCKRSAAGRLPCPLRGGSWLLRGRPSTVGGRAGPSIRTRAAGSLSSSCGRASTAVHRLWWGGQVQGITTHLHRSSRLRTRAGDTSSCRSTGGLYFVVWARSRAPPWSVVRDCEKRPGRGWERVGRALSVPLRTLACKPRSTASNGWSGREPRDVRPGALALSGPHPGALGLLGAGGAPVVEVPQVARAAWSRARPLSPRPHRADAPAPARSGRGVAAGPGPERTIGLGVAAPGSTPGTWLPIRSSSGLLCAARRSRTRNDR